VHIKDLYTIIVTEKRAECRDFYFRWFGFTVVFEALGSCISRRRVTTRSGWPS
jgi:hypothetical protein